MSISRKFQRSKSKYTLSQKIISAVTAAGFIMQPFTAFAGQIVKPDGENLINNGVADIWADKVVGNAAVNVFNKFNLSANEIANMYFGTSKGNHNAANLVNFVNDRIDINGTVNAVQNSQIGGNLFFLSKEGMAVGKSGVINTGSLYVMTPTSTFMEDIIGADGKSFNEANFKAQWGDGAGNIARMQVPVNQSGTISVLGTVNAANEVKMMAAQIGVGKNVSGDNAYDVTAEEAKNALIRTNVVDFSDFVNIKNSEAEVTAGLNGKLEAQVDANSGDIVLKAVASTVNSVDENFDKFEGSNNQALATVTINGTVNARGDAEITAEATNGVNLKELFDDESVIEGDDKFTEAFGQITKNVAVVDINGQVTGQHVDIEANTVNNYISNTDEDVNLGVITELAGIIGPNWDASYAVLANEATVNINKGAVVTANAAAEEGKNALNISADSSLKASVGASTSAIKLANIKKTESVPAASVGYVKADNSAAVNIAGELHSAGHTNISANADNTVELTSADTTTQLKGQPTVFNVAVAIANGSNSSSVDIKNTAQMTDLNGDLDITATSSNSIDTQALVKGKEGSFVGTAVNVTNFDSSADIKIDTAVEADSVDIAAGNSVIKNNVVADNNVGSNYFTNFLVSRATGTKTVEGITGFLGEVKETLLGESKPDTINALNKLGEWASVGVSVGVVNETNNADVTLTKNAQITAQNSSGTKGDISVTANNYIADTSMSVTGATNNYDKDVSNVALVNAAVLVSDMDSNANVTLEGGDAHDAKDAKYTQLDGAQISVKANSEFNYGRIDKMIGDLLLLCNKLEGAYASNATYKQHVEDLKTKAEEFKQNCAADPGYADSTEGNEAALALAAAAQQVSLDASDASVAEQIKDIFVGPLSVVGAAAQFANPNNYANFQAGASTGGKKDDAAKVAVSGAVNLNYITNNANVILGKNTEITGSGKVDINAGAAQADVAFNGKLGITGGADNAAGGTVGVHYAEVNSMVAIAEGAEVTGSAINIGAENDVAHTAITFGAGKSEGNALAGMGSYLEGDSNSIVSVDDEANLTATGRDEYKEDKDKPVPDDITGISDGSVNITAHNNTVLTNIAGGGAIGGENAAIGASVAITDYDVYNMAGIVNNDAGVSTNVGEATEDETEEQKRDRVQQENIAKLQELTKNQSGLNDTEYKNLFGSAERTVAGAGINAHDVNVDVLTDGVINTVTIAGSAVTGSDFDKPGIGDKLGNFVSNMQNRVENSINKLDTAVQNKYNGTMNSPDLKPTDMQASNPNEGQKRPSFSISGAGSSSVNLIDGASTALLDGAKITLSNDTGGNAGKLNVSATDSSFIGAWSGAAAISWKTFMTGQNWENKSVGFAGSVGVNMVNTDAASIIRSSTINNAGSITNTADKSGALVAAGLGMAVEKSGVSGSGGQNYGGAASVSVNDSENDIYALMQDNIVNNDTGTTKTVLTNSAYDNDVQVTGGINASIALGGQQGAAVGGTVTYANVANNVQSVIAGGTYNNLGTVDVSAVTDITQVGAAVGIGVATGSQKDYGAEGVAAYNMLTNNADAVIDGASITADKVNVEAHDEDLGENKYTDYINERGLDATGETYLQNISDTTEDLYETDQNGNMALDENGQPILKVGQSGNTIVTGALGISASTGGGGGNGSAAISISDINNDFNASITDSTIKANGSGLAEDNIADVNVFAKSDTLLVGVAAGVGANGKGFGGAGSFAWNTINNDNTASIENSTIDAASAKVNAISGTLGVNVAGQISVGKQAVGLAVAYNDLENNTGAYVLGSNIKNTTTDADGKEVFEETDVTVAAENSGKIYAVGAGVGVSPDSLAANGTVAINRGNNNLEAIIGDYGSTHTNITNAENISVVANDSSSLLGVAGGVGISRQVAVGGSVAYNEIGNISANEDDKKQQNTAQINNAVITTADGDTTTDGVKINVQALDNAKLTTAAVGVGVAAGNGVGVAVQGAAATALINKDTEASMSGVSITKQNTSGKGADVVVEADSNNSILTTADTASVAVGSTAVAVGAGVAVNRSEAGVKALVSGGSMNVNNLEVNAANSAAIETIGIGGSVAGGMGAGVTGSVAVNMIGNDTTAEIDGGADITAENNVVVDAQSDEQIANYAGSASVAAQGAAVGLSVSVNQIDGTTNASIEGSGTQVNAAGNYEDAELNNTVGNDEEDYILKDFVDSSTFDSQGSLGDKRTGKTYSGVAVSASSTHSIKSFLINAGVAAQGAAVNGTVNVNQTDGSTTAAIKDAAINQNGFTGDVNVIAHDYSNSAGIVGSVAAVGEGAGIGLGADTNTLSRDITAEITGTENNINGNAVNVEAEAKQGVSSMAIGVGGAVIGAGVANGTTVTLVDGKTIAKINGRNITAGSLNVTAKHLDRINTNGISIGVGGLGAGIGIGVAVLNENSTTEATVENTDVTYTNADGKTVINADNTTVMNYQLYNVGGAIAGVAGSVGVANVNSKVNANVIGSNFGAAGSETNKAGSIAVGAANDIDFDQTAGTAGAGAVGVGVGVSVNTIDSQVQTNVKNSNLYAKGNIDVTAEETRNVDQLAVNAGAGGIAAGANVMVTNVGKEVSNAYGTDGMDEVNVEQAYQEAQNAINGGKLTSDYTLGALNDTEAGNASGNAVPGKGGQQDSIVKVDIDGATLKTDGNISAEAHETTNVNMEGINAQLAAGGSAAGTVGILNVYRNSGVEITSAELDAADVDIKAIQSGLSKLNIYQGAGAVGGAIGAAYGSINSEGKSGVGIGNSTITSDEDVDITANDESSTEVNAIGVSVAAGSAASIIVAQGSNEAETTVTVDETDIAAETNNINIHAERQAKDEKGNKVDSLIVSAKAASGGLMFAGAGVGATADELGKVGVTVAGGSNFTAGSDINITALNAPSVRAETGSLSASMVASGAITVAEANIGKHIEPEDKENENKEDNGHLKTFVNITEGNSFTAKSLTAEARADAAQNVKMEGLSLSASLLPNGALQANTGGAEVYSDVEVNVANNVFKGSDTEAAANGIDLDISGVNSVDQKVNASGISVSTVFASGTNIANSSAQLSTQVQVDGPSEDSEINNVDLNASSYAKVDTDANGYGGAIADASPYAAKVNNNYTADTDVIINGDWNTAGSFDAQAVNGMDIDLKSDAVRAAVVGLSGTWLDNTINNAANVTVNNANITTGGAQSYVAQNTVDYNGEIDGSGYGGITANATEYYDDLDFNAGVDITGSTLHGAGDGGSITAFANTQGTINSKNSLKSAGVIPVALAFSDHAIDYDNRVNVVNSDLTTDKADADITLAATDDTDVELETIADTQGGVAGAASAEASNNFNRANKINIDRDSNLLSTKDINLYAGADANGTKSSLNLQVLADAYNKTAIPVYTDPTVNNNMTQSNQIELAGNAESVRHINASAAKGFTTVTESAKEYKVWTGTGGEGNVASTALGDQIKNETADNYINVTGTAKAGVHNKLDITIDGHSSTAAQPTYEERPLIGSDGKQVLDDEGNPVMEEVLVDKGDVSYKDVIITVDDGEETDWFNKNQITPDNLVVVNGLMERYNQVMEYLAAYAEGSEAYEAYEKEKNLLLTEMLKAGLAERDGNNNIVPLDYIDVPAISLPDIVVSGGNINLETDTLKGSGEITAQGAPQISITNNSDLYLKVQDVTISDNGGNVYLTGNKTFTGKWQEDGTSANTPTITIHGGSGDESQFTQYGNQHPQADIGIFGDITNTAGDVKIINDNYSILVDGNVSGRNIQITATRGNVTQQSSSGVLNVGNDPITKLQFSEAVAEKIQKYLHSLKQDGSKEFKDYTAYLDWLINTVGITLSELGYAGDVNNITGYTKTWNEVLSAVAQKEGLSNTAANTFMEEKKTEGFNAYVSYLNELGIGYKYNAATLNATISEESAGILAGGNIYIDAVNVNIGGLIQSGYGAYSTKLTADDNAKVEDLDKEWQANKVVLTDNDVLGNSKYLINGGGEVYNTDTHVWDYEVKVYYNPSTGQLITESVRPEGGNIQISGKVSSTGGGRIMAMDGTSNVNINTAAVDKDVKVNSITVNDITGLISITDKNVTEDSAGKKVDGWVTEYKNGQWREYAYGTDASSIAWQTGVKDAYKPVEGTQFAWTGGASGEVIREKHYTEDFLFWGALSYNTSEALLDHLEQIGVDVEGTVISSGSSEDPTPMKDGSLITDGYKGGGNMFRIDWTYTNPQNQEEVKATDPTVKKKYDGVAGKIFGYGEYTYTWTETTGDQMASTTGIKADNTIQIGFLGNGNGEGNIKVDSAQDMLLNGNISNATIVDANNDFAGKGSVNLTSNNGSVSAIGSANINSDNVNIEAATGVNVNHTAIGGSANINIATDSGDIKFVSTGGDLNIEQAVTGGTNPIDATTGSVYLEAQGNLIDAATGSYAVKGQRIDLISNTGAIGSKDKAFTVLGGSELYSSDTMASSVNAQAQGDIVLTQFDGNLRLGTIVSEDGDAVLTVNSGSFVDAHPSENSDSSSAQDKIDRWLEAGLIVEKDADGNEVAADNSEASAEQAKAERVNALTARMEALAAEGEHTVNDYTDAAEDFYKDISAAKADYLKAVAEAKGDQNKIDSAYEKYQTAQKAYFEGKGFSEAEQETIINYAELANSDNYGWSKNQLLYAIQDSVLNAEPGKDVLTVETPNVTANNITLNASAGGVGIDGAAQFISNDKLNIEENLKLLAAAKAGDLTWGENEDGVDGVTIRQQQAITVSVNEKADGTYGNVNVDANKNVYLAGVKDTQLNITGVDTDGNIRLQGDKGINVSDMLSGEDLTLTGGIGNIMGNEVIDDVGYIKTDVTGNVYANADGDINIHHIGGTDDAGNNVDLKLLAISTNNVANLKAENSILMYTDPNTEAQGRINADIVNLTAGGAIGEEDNAIRILDNGAVVNADAEGNIYLSGVSGEGSKEELVLGTVEGANLDVTSVSSIKQTADGKITANEVNASATKDILLGSEENEVNSFVVNGLGDDNSVDGSVDIVSKANNADGVVNVEFGKDVNGNKVGLTVNNGYVNVSSLGDTSNLNITGGSVTTIGEKADGVTFTSEGGINADVVVDSTTDVDFNVNTGDITLGGDLTANNGNITIDIAGDGNLIDTDLKDTDWNNPANVGNTLMANGPEGSEEAGNIYINVGRDANGTGDVNLYDLVATNDARVDVNNGKLALHKINGELVAIQLRTQGKEMNVGEIIAGTQIVLSGSNMDLDQITQREDADGMLVITPDGAEEDKPIDNFTIGDIRTNDDTGIRFERLWVNNSDIHMSQGQLWFDKLYVEDTAHFSNDNMTAAVYGVPPLRDGSDSVYWNNTAENRPEDNLDLWQSGNGDWMYLRFTDDNIQESNGILLTLDEYDYVYDQRFTAENHLRWQHGRYLDEDWKQAYGYGLSLHNRYGLIDYQEFTETNAGADEVAVEA